MSTDFPTRASSQHAGSAHTPAGVRQRRSGRPAWDVLLGAQRPGPAETSSPSRPSPGSVTGAVTPSRATARPPRKTAGGPPTPRTPMTWTDLGWLAAVLLFVAAVAIAILAQHLHRK